MSVSLRVVRHALVAGGLTLAVLAAMVGSPSPPARAASVDVHDDTNVAATNVSANVAPVVPANLRALQLAAWIREGARDVRVLDLRGDSAYEAHHIPSAESIDPSQLDSIASDKDATLVLYSDDDVRDIQAWANLAARGHRRAYVLSGGMPSWMEEVMEPVLRGDSADYVAALSRYFGGTPHPASARDSSAVPQRAASARAPEPKRGIAPVAAPSDEFGRTRRRGC
jgi:rhodanese-related sulfurtransferase